MEAGTVVKLRIKGNKYAENFTKGNVAGDINEFHTANLHNCRCSSALARRMITAVGA